MAGADRPDDAEDRDDGPRRKQIHRHHRGRRGRGRGDGGVGVREPRRPEPDSGSDAVELDPEDTQ